MKNIKSNSALFLFLCYELHFCRYQNDPLEQPVNRKQSTRFTQIYTSNEVKIFHITRKNRHHYLNYESSGWM
jgi:hypothetical protein